LPEKFGAKVFRPDFFRLKIKNPKKIPAESSYARIFLEQMDILQEKRVAGKFMPAFLLDAPLAPSLPPRGRGRKRFRGYYLY